MSHFTTIKTKLRDMEALSFALEACGYQTEKSALAKGWYGHTVKADLKASHERLKGYDLAFNRIGEELEVTADWSMIQNSSKIMSEIQQQYARCVAIGQLEAAGFSLIEEKQGDQILLTATRYR